jgi:hypothetical protein
MNQSQIRPQNFRQVLYFRDNPPDCRIRRSGQPPDRRRFIPATIQDANATMPFPAPVPAKK